jgi:hypothetical protein
VQVIPELLNPSLQLRSIFPFASNEHCEQDFLYASAAQVAAKEEPINNPNNASTSIFFMRL